MAPSYSRTPPSDPGQSAVPVNGTATPTHGEVRALAHSAAYALHVLAWLNATGFKDAATRRATLGQDLARQLEAAQASLWDDTRPFSDRAGRIADGFHVLGPPLIGPLDRPEVPAIPTRSFWVSPTDPHDVACGQCLTAGEAAEGWTPISSLGLGSCRCNRCGTPGPGLARRLAGEERHDRHPLET